MNKEAIKKTPKKRTDKTSLPAGAAQKEIDGNELEETGIKGILTRLAHLFGFGQTKKKKYNVEIGDVSTNLAHQRTDLAMERNYMAAERTLMGWIRTALSMISFGFTIGKLGQVIQDISVKGIMGSTRTLSIENIAYFLVILGTVALVGAALQYRRRIQELRSMGLRRQIGIAFIMALLLAVIGGFALSGLVLAL
jgi:putative membrane protein